MRYRRLVLYLRWLHGHAIDRNVGLCLVSPLHRGIGLPHESGSVACLLFTYCPCPLVLGIVNVTKRIELYPAHLARMLSRSRTNAEDIFGLRIVCDVAGQPWIGCDQRPSIRTQRPQAVVTGFLHGLQQARQALGDDSHLDEPPQGVTGM